MKGKYPKSSGDLYKDFFESSQACMVILNEKGEIITSNAAFNAYIGNAAFSKKLLFRDYILPDDRSVSFTFKEQFLKGHSKQAYDLRIINESGNYNWFKLKITAVQNADGSLNFHILMKDIHELKILNEKSIIQEHIKESIIKGLPGIFYISNLKGEIREYNQNLKHFFYRENHFSTADYILEEDQLLAKNLREEAIKKGSAQATLRLINKKNEIRHYLITNQVIMFYDEVCTMGIGIDVTNNINDRLDLQERVKELKCIAKVSEISNSESFHPNKDLKRIVKTIANAFLQPKNTIVTITYKNHTYSNESGHKGIPVTHYQRNLKSGKLLQVEIRFIQPSPILHEEEKMVNVICDILTSSLNRLEVLKNLIDSEQRYKNLFDYAPALIIIWDPNKLKVVEVNKEACDVYGYSHEEFINLSVFDYRPKEDHNKIQEFAKKMTKSSAATVRGTWKHILKNGELRYMDITSHPFYYQGERCVLSLAKDITELVEKENFLRESNKQIRKLNRSIETAREDERARISRDLHDNLQQELVLISLYSSSLKENLKHDSHLSESTDLICNMVRQAIETTRTIAKNLRPQDDSKNLNDILSKYCFEMEQRTGLKINFSFYKTAVETNSELNINLFRVLQEALNNIVKHAHATEVEVCLSILNNTLSLSISDNGVGFEFDPQKTDGIGLIGIRERITQFNGDFSISSRIGEGSTYAISIPLNEQSVEEVQ